MVIDGGSDFSIGPPPKLFTNHHVTLSEKNGKYFVDDQEVDPNHPEEWGSIMLAKMAKSYLK
jgi:hypothetical protein